MLPEIHRHLPEEQKVDVSKFAVKNPDTGEMELTTDAIFDEKGQLKVMYGPSVCSSMTFGHGEWADPSTHPYRFTDEED